MCFVDRCVTVSNETRTIDNLTEGVTIAHRSHARRGARTTVRIPTGSSRDRAAMAPAPPAPAALRTDPSPARLRLAGRGVGGRPFRRGRTRMASDMLGFEEIPCALPLPS
jgi:hypothetical protein